METDSRYVIGQERHFFEMLKRILEYDPPDWRRPGPTASQEGHQQKKIANGCDFCNRYHLSGHCKGEEDCKYKHPPHLKDQELLAQRHLARSMYCGIGCEDFDCHYTHHYRYGRDCGMGGNCKFNETHYIDLKRVAKIYEDGTKEHVSSP
ncbi:uncharacterized protein PpBr36_11023 [Pyricularia pennisetigena]|uniref:uncharacterized protein n=1 Tax=Pyricularia pennisetigena TaxID=1578925 RepID=UPI001152C62B|nr:uncharacterized protein PpBr36_11023 [Pyricularia pennisetigena]TLS20760.1 hypothetical protein PpBr36_11023 [Pyricularia pennisetigena]